MNWALSRRQAILKILSTSAVLSGVSTSAFASSSAALGLDHLQLVVRGLPVLLVRAPWLHSATVGVTYKAGSRDDPAQLQGLAHFTEHLMFKGSANVAADAYEGMAEGSGGAHGAFTSEDFTHYYATVPGERLLELLRAELDRMSGLTFSDSDFVSEKSVLLAEISKRLQPQQEFLLNQQVMARAFEGHPYGQSLVGDPSQVERISALDVRRNHQALYRPDNAYLVVISPLRLADLQDMVQTAATLLIGREGATVRAPVVPVPLRRTHFKPEALRNSPAISYAWQGAAWGLAEQNAFQLLRRYLLMSLPVAAQAPDVLREASTIEHWSGEHAGLFFVRVNQPFAQTHVRDISGHLQSTIRRLADSEGVQHSLLKSQQLSQALERQRATTLVESLSCQWLGERGVSQAFPSKATWNRLAQRFAQLPLVVSHTA